MNWSCSNTSISRVSLSQGSELNSWILICRCGVPSPGWHLWLNTHSISCGEDNNDTNQKALNSCHETWCSSTYTAIWYHCHNILNLKSGDLFTWINITIVLNFVRGNPPLTYSNFNLISILFYLLPSHLSLVFACYLRLCWTCQCHLRYYLDMPLPLLILYFYITQSHVSFCHWACAGAFFKRRVLAHVSSVSLFLQLSN